MMRRALAGMSLWLVLAAPAGADEATALRARLLGDLWSATPRPVPASIPPLLWEMTSDPGVGASVLARAGQDHRALTHELIQTLSMSEPEALGVLPSLYVVRAPGLSPDQRPPTWADVRWVGLQLLRAVAPREQGRDLRRERDLDEALAQMPYHKPAEIAGLVVLWEDWWADRGDDRTLYLDASLVPDVADWLAQFDPPSGATAASVLDMAQKLHDDPLRRRLFLAALDPDRHAFAVAEAIDVIQLYQPEFVERGVRDRQWNPQRGRMEGYHAEDLREIAMQVLERTTRHLSSGVDENARITDWLSWWRSARMQARYYRDPLAAPTFEIWLGGLDQPVEQGGKPMVTFLRDFYVAEGLRLSLLERLGPSHQAIVAELMQWLGKDADGARADGFEMVHRRWPIRPRYKEAGELMMIPWPEVQRLIRDMLHAITDVEGLPEDDLPDERLDAFWQDWWRYHEGEPQWYRGEPPASVRPRFAPERARSG